MKRFISTLVVFALASTGLAQDKKKELSDSDKTHIAAQKICPVSGNQLGSMGQPVKVKVGKNLHAFLCCKGCQGKKISKEHWKTVQKNLAKAQGTCPIMDKPVDETMEYAVVKGRKIFVCCPPCIKKLEEDPAKSIAMLNRQVTDNLKKENK